MIRDISPLPNSCQGADGMQVFVQDPPHICLVKLPILATTKLAKKNQRKKLIWALYLNDYFNLRFLFIIILNFRKHLKEGKRDTRACRKVYSLGTSPIFHKRGEKLTNEDITTLFWRLVGCVSLWFTYSTSHKIRYGNFFCTWNSPWSGWPPSESWRTRRSQQCRWRTADQRNVAANREIGSDLHGKWVTFSGSRKFQGY